MSHVDFISKIHTGTKRDYVARAVEFDKAECAEKAVHFGYDYWDGERQYGYGGYKYDGRWRSVAEDMAKHYNLKPGDRILDVGCGRAFLLYEFTQVVPGIEVVGIDISNYAVETSKDEVRPYLQVCSAQELPFPDNYFDFVVTLNTLHNLYVNDLFSSLKEIERVGKSSRKHVVVEAYRSEQEKVNLMYWQLTCRAFHTPSEWEWIFAQTGYSGDYSFIYFE